MKKQILFFASTLVCHLMVHGQDTDTFQPDSVYSKYNIHFQSAYYDGSSSKSREIFVIDRSGRYAGFILTDNETGKVPQLTMAYKYNSNGVLSTENDTSFRGTHYSVKKAELFYGPDGVLIKKVFKADGKVINEISYVPNENKETETLYRKGSVYRQQTSYYDKHNKKIRFTGTEPVDKNAKPQVLK